MVPIRGWLLSCLWIASYLVSSSPIKDDLNLVDLQRDGELVFVHVMFRHGDRTPLQQNPGDKYGVTYWPEGWGQLTKLGKQQQFKLGKWFGSRYHNFLSNVYNLSDIYIQSSDVDRTLMSTQANLAGLYPPTTKSQIWNPSLLWQPIPVHTQNMQYDYLIASSVPSSCTAYQKSYNKNLQSSEMKAYRESLAKLYEYLSANTGVPVTYYQDERNVRNLRDSWVCESSHELPLPKWTQKVYPNNDSFYQAALKYYYLSCASKFLSKFSTGFLLKDILDRLTHKVNNNLSPDRKFWMYGTHDDNIFRFLYALGISDNKFVPYAASIILELRYYNNEHYVQIFYKNSDRDPDPITIPGCGKACPLSNMYEIYEDILPKHDFNTECGIEE